MAALFAAGMLLNGGIAYADEFNSVQDGDFDRPLTPGEETNIIWSYGPDGANNFADYHGGNRGSLTVEL